MDEILIEEKKYVSSKQAAKLTGYAKDYIGQLCREGRVPARLVGRSWYVLEAAIQDHRFGNAMAVESVESIIKAPEPVLHPTWDTPRYEAISPAEVLPSINRLEEMREPAPIEQGSDEKEVPEDSSKHLQDSWQAWFSRMADSAPITVTPPLSEDKKEEGAGKVVEETGIEDEEVNIPIHAIHHPLSDDNEALLPRITKNAPEEESAQADQEDMRQIPLQKSSRNGGMRAMRTIRIFAVLLATIMASIAILGSGYVDSYILSNSQARLISGISVYNK